MPSETVTEVQLDMSLEIISGRENAEFFDIGHADKFFQYGWPHEWHPPESMVRQRAAEILKSAIRGKIVYTTPST